MIPSNCPECGSRDVRRVRHVVLLSIAAIFLAIDLAFGQEMLAILALVIAVAVVLLPDLRCTRCLYRWNPRREHPEPPPPDDADTVEEPCPKCGSIEVYDRGYPIVGPRCDACGATVDPTNNKARSLAGGAGAAR